MGKKKMCYADGRTGATLTAISTPTVAVGIACPTPTATVLGYHLGCYTDGPD
jgi:hypothetical protein